MGPTEGPEAEQGVKSSTKTVTWKVVVGAGAAIYASYKLLKRFPDSPLPRKAIKIAVGTATTISLTSLFFGDADPTNPLTYVLNPTGNGQPITKQALLGVLQSYATARPTTLTTQFLQLVDAVKQAPPETVWVKIGDQLIPGVVDKSPPSSYGADP